MSRNCLDLALVGYGKMGRAIERLAVEAGHRILVRVDPAEAEAESRIPRSLDCDVALEFTDPAAAPDNVARLLEGGLAVVSGSTGWSDRLPEMQQAARRKGALLWAPNFALGVNVLFRLTEMAGRWLAAVGGFDPYLFEAHHAAKLDGPSGTARRLAEIVVETTPDKAGFGRPPASGAIAADLLSVCWARAGAIPGEHRVCWDAPAETIEIVHRARGREVFAAGALRAAEWLAGRRGAFEIGQMLDDLLPPVSDRGPEEQP